MARVFVLTPGRNGSTTISKAFEHSEKFSSGQQTNWGKFFPERLEYPDNHVESDARNLFFAHLIAEKYHSEETHWIVLERDLAEISYSYAKRRTRKGIVRNFSRGVLDSSPKFETDWVKSAEAYVYSADSIIKGFIRGRQNVHTIPLENPFKSFTDLWTILDAGKGLEKALDEWRTRHNSSS